ncbi:MAG: glycogen synthase [Ruminococcaceae bacterium]|nr:glycogen synthase [Oscillospiraceae bacterium]
MKILYCTSEANPFAGSGGLADVAGSLPHTLCRKGQDCRIVMPLYGTIPYELKCQLNFITNFTVPVAWRQMYCGLFWARHHDCTYYFIDNEYYFKRDKLYGFYDDAERFAFFSRAILEMLPHIDFHPDIIHTNDWQTALVPTYYYLFYSKNPWYYNIKNIFTIHNIQYQGKYGWDVNTECVGIPESEQKILEMDGKLNMVKGAIQTAVRVTTVSPSYALEIKDPWYSHGLHHPLINNHYKLCGILNGIEPLDWDPATDYHLYRNYTMDDMSGKGECKRALQERLGLEQRWDIPMVAMVTRLVSHKGLDLVKGALENLLNTENMQFVVLGTGDEEYENFFRDMQWKYPGRVCFCQGFIPELARKIYSGADIFLMPSKSEPCGLAQMIALRYGTIPVVREVGGLKDSVFDSADNYGNGFTFKNYTADDMAHAVRRALWGIQDDHGWHSLMWRAMMSNNSWDRSANDYIVVYEDTLRWA